MSDDGQRLDDPEGHGELELGSMLDDRIDAQIHAAGIRPDLAEVLARARAMDPGAVPFDRLDHEPSAADSPGGDGSPGEATEANGSKDATHVRAPGADLLPFVSAYRSAIDEAVDLRLLGPLAPPRAVAPRYGRLGLGRRRVATAAMVGAAVAMVAVVTLAAVGGTSWLGQPSVRATASQAARQQAASHRWQASGQGESSEVRSPSEAFIGQSRDGDATPPTIDLPLNLAGDAARATEDVPDVETGDVETGDVAAKDGPRRARGPRLEGTKLETRLELLDDAARRAWRNGDLSQAEALFRKIIKVGGRHRLAELAYGDLFSLTAQRGKSLGPVWRAYLRRFPKGRYAEDARAGLCRLAAGEARATCWAAYRSDFPGGTHTP